jgi:hypothetical protein
LRYEVIRNDVVRIEEIVFDHIDAKVSYAHLADAPQSSNRPNGRVDRLGRHWTSASSVESRLVRGDRGI